MDEERIAAIERRLDEMEKRYHAKPFFDWRNAAAVPGDRVTSSAGVDQLREAFERKCQRGLRTRIARIEDLLTKAEETPIPGKALRRRFQERFLAGEMSFSAALEVCSLYDVSIDFMLSRIGTSGREGKIQDCFRDVVESLNSVSATIRDRSENFAERIFGL